MLPLDAAPISLALDHEVVASAWEQVGGSIFSDLDAEHAVPSAIMLDLSEVEACLRASQDPISRKPYSAYPSYASDIPSSKALACEVGQDLLGWDETLPLPLSVASPVPGRQQLQPLSFSDVSQMQSFQRVPDHNGSSNSRSSSGEAENPDRSLPSAKRAKTAAAATSSKRNVHSSLQLQQTGQDASVGVVPDAFAPTAAPSTSSSCSSDSSLGVALGSVGGGTAAAAAAAAAAAVQGISSLPAPSAATGAQASHALRVMPTMHIKVEPGVAPPAAALTFAAQARPTTVQYQHQQTKQLPAAVQAVHPGSLPSSVAGSAAAAKRSWSTMTATPSGPGAAAAAASWKPAGVSGAAAAATAAAPWKPVAAPGAAAAAAAAAAKGQHGTRPLGHDSQAHSSAAAAAAAAAATAMIEGFVRTRAEALARYRAKRARRTHTKKIRYHLRKVNADKRPRIKGRFVKKDEAGKYLEGATADGGNSSSGSYPAAAACGQQDTAALAATAARAGAGTGAGLGWEQQMSFFGSELPGMNFNPELLMIKMEDEPAAATAATQGGPAAAGAAIVPALPSQTAAAEAAAAAADQVMLPSVFGGADTAGDGALPAGSTAMLHPLEYHHPLEQHCFGFDAMDDAGLLDADFFDLR